MNNDKSIRDTDTRDAQKRDRNIMEMERHMHQDVIEQTKPGESTRPETGAGE